jgi:hypothetical protein
MKLNLPRLQNLADVRKYLMVIETLELNKLNSAISVNADMHSHRRGVQDLRTLKQYYGDLTEFLFKKQTEARLDEFERAFVFQLEDFVRFWQVAMADFKGIYDEELERVLERNEELKTELNEMLEKTLGFQAPPNALFLNLLAIRKLAVRLKNDEATQFLNFDHFRRHNEKINEKWIRDRKNLILTRLEHFERRLAECTETIKYKLNLELAKLHSKRTKQLDRLMIKYGKVKRSVEGINHKELHELKKLKDFFIMKHSIPVYYHTNDMFKNGILDEVGKGPAVVDEWEPMLEEEPREPTPTKKGGKHGLSSTSRKDKEAKMGTTQSREAKKAKEDKKGETESTPKGKKDLQAEKKQTGKA